MAVTPLVKKDGTRVDGKTNDPMEELMLLLAKGKDIKVIIDGELCLINIKPFAFERLPEVTKATAPILKPLQGKIPTKEDLKKLVANKSFTEIAQLIEAHKPKIIDLITAFEPDLTEAQINTMSIDAIADLVITIIEVNLDFFIRRVSPHLMGRLMEVVAQVPKYGLTLPKR